jgi:hypothetical protein
MGAERDILQIFEFVELTDLISFYQAFQTLTHIIQSAVVSSIWHCRFKQAGLRLLECPAFLTEPDFAALAFVARCSVRLSYYLPPFI